MLSHPTATISWNSRCILQYVGVDPHLKICYVASPPPPVLYINCDCALQATLAQVARDRNYVLPFTAQTTSVNLASTNPNAAATTCQRKFTRWCLDGTNLSRADVAGIIVGGCIFVLIVVGAAGLLVYRLNKRRRS